MLELVKVQYSELNARQKEIFNFQKVAAELADFGFNCIKLTDDWLGADFLAYHKDRGNTLKVQLKARLTISRKYIDKDIFMTFPIKNNWYLISHEELVDIVSKHTSWLDADSWINNGLYSSASPSKTLVEAIKYAKL